VPSQGNELLYKQPLLHKQIVRTQLLQQGKDPSQVLGRVEVSFPFIFWSAVPIYCPPENKQKNAHPFMHYTSKKLANTSLLLLGASV
jgi:hypothetical protein